MIMLLNFLNNSQYQQYMALCLKKVSFHFKLLNELHTHSVHGEISDRTRGVCFLIVTPFIT